jgi:perosamine synthetase
MIYVNKPAFLGNEKKYLLNCIKTGWVSSDGPYVKKFERNFAKFVGRKFASTVTNGSAALEIAIRALNLKKGSEVILPSFTIISCCNAIVNAGLKPVLVDCYQDTFNMSVEEVKKKISKKTSAIMIVHIYGLTVNLDPILSIAKSNKLKIIEDASEMHGQKYKKKMCGSFGDVSTFSFYANKHITTGEGGMILTNNKKIFINISKLKNLFFGTGVNRFKHSNIGWNHRFTNVQASIGLAQLERIKKIVEKKFSVGLYYTKKLKVLSESLTLPLTSNEYCKNIYWVYAVLIKDHIKLNSDAIIRLLKKKGIDCRPFFYPMHLQPVFKKKLFFKKEKYPVSEKISKKGFYLPGGLGITRKEQDVVIRAMIETFSKNIKSK